MGFFQDLKEDLSQAVSEFAGEEKIKEETAVEMHKDSNADLFAAAEESMGIEYSGDVDETSVEAALGSFLDQVAANAESAEERYEAKVPAYEPKTSSYEPKYEAKTPAYEARYEEPAKADTYAEDEGDSYEYESPYKSEEPVISDEVAVITKNMIVNGDMLSTGSLDVCGVINGNIKVNGELNVTGEINGNSEASNIIMTNCNVNGDVISTGAVKIGARAVVRGNVYATSAVISGAIKGDIDVHGPVILDSTAIVKGNIKSKAVQINNGAAVEGMCSQCYAEVSPSAFFGD